jgi:hypothetical protein
MRVKNISIIDVTPTIDGLLGYETEIRLKDGEILDGVPLEVSYAYNDSPHLIFEESHGDYVWVDVKDIASIRRAA